MSAMMDLSDTRAVERGGARPRSFSRPFWEATRERRFLLQYDPRCQKFQFYPRPASIFDGGPVEWREVSGGGSLFSSTIVRRAPGVFRGHEPFAIGLVSLDEGVNVMANIVECAAADLRIGMRLRVVWQPLPDGTNLPMFAPDPSH
jgi:uncharacterized OB-fold protein